MRLLPEEPKQLRIVSDVVNISGESVDDTISMDTTALSLPPLSVQRIFRYRLVLKEPVDNVKSLNQVFIALRDGHEVICCAAKCDWAHRDISAGNMYFYEGRGLIGDSEDAKMIGIGYTKDDRGTVNYMAIEVAKGSYSFLPDDSGDSETDTAEEAEEIHLEEDQEGEGLIFTHVPIHDVESLWWIAICWIFRNKVFKMESPIAEDWDFKNQLEIECGIFPCYRVFKSLERHVFFKEDVEYKKAMRTLHFGLKEISNGLYAIRKRLHRLYRRLERDLIGKNPKLDEGAYRRASLARIRNLFDACARVSEGMKMEKLTRGRKPEEGYQDWETDSAKEIIRETEVLHSQP